MNPTPERAEKRFRSLSEHSRQSNADLESYFDSESAIDALPRAKFEAYKKLLSSIATVEGIEHVMVHPVAHYFRANEPVYAYLESHARDENLHSELFQGYVRHCFRYEKKKRSLTDRIIYDRALPQLAKIARHRPVAFALGVSFLEKYASHIYVDVKRSAERDGLPGLTRLLEAVEKDERRHMVGIEAVIDELMRSGKIDRVDRVTARVILGLFLVDVSQSPYAIYNRHVRMNMLALGIDPDFIDGRGRHYAREALAILDER